MHHILLVCPIFTSIFVNFLILSGEPYPPELREPTSKKFKIADVILHGSPLNAYSIIRAQPPEGWKSGPVVRHIFSYSGDVLTSYRMTFLIFVMQDMQQPLGLLSFLN